MYGIYSYFITSQLVICFSVSLISISFRESCSLQSAAFRMWYVPHHGMTANRLQISLVDMHLLMVNGVRLATSIEFLFGSLYSSPRVTEVSGNMVGPHVVR